MKSAVSFRKCISGCLMTVFGKFMTINLEAGDSGGLIRMDGLTFAATRFTTN